jgi:hypothetical protein
VILSGLAASQSEAAAESKDPYLPLLHEPLAAFSGQTLSLKLPNRRQRLFDSVLAFLNESRNCAQDDRRLGVEVLNPQ